MSDKPIKSVQRVFEILEMFDKERRPLAAKEIAEHLGYPLVSAHQLCKSMRQLGYLDVESSNHTYTPSRALSSLLDWARDYVDREANILAFIKALNRETKETVNLSRRIGTHAKIVYGMESLHPVSVSVKVGTMMPAARSLTGISSISNLDAAEIDVFLKDLAKRDAAQAKKVDRALIDDILGELLNRGTVVKADIFVQGIGAVCLPIQTATSSDVYVVGVVGPSKRILDKQAEHRKTLKRLAADFEIETVFKLRNPRKG